MNFLNFEQLDIRIIKRELYTEFSKEFIDEIKVIELLESINDLMSELKTNIKTEIRDKFYSYFKLLKQ